MSFTVTDTKKFRALIEALGEVTKEAVFRTRNGHLSVRAMAITTFYGFAFDLPIQGAFTTEEFGINVDDLQKATKVLGETAQFLIEGGNLIITSGSKRVQLAIYETSYIKELPKILTPGKSKLIIPTKEWSQILKETTLFTPILQFKTVGKDLFITSRDAGIQNSAQIRIDADTEIATSLYDSRCLETMQPLSKVFDEITLSFGTNYPLHLRYEQDGCIAQFILANRVEDAS